jgi:hypothetical protein
MVSPLHFSVSCYPYTIAPISTLFKNDPHREGHGGITKA